MEKKKAPATGADHRLAGVLMLRPREDRSVGVKDLWRGVAGRRWRWMGMGGRKGGVAKGKGGRKGEGRGEYEVRIKREDNKRGSDDPHLCRNPKSLSNRPHDRDSPVNDCYRELETNSCTCVGASVGGFGWVVEGGGGAGGRGGQGRSRLGLVTTTFSLAIRS